MRRALVILWLISLSSCAVIDDNHHAAEVSPTVEDSVFNLQLSHILQKALENSDRFQEADSISASLYISGRCHWEGTTGTTKQDPRIPVETDMLFGFGSITKTFVAAIVLQLVEENLLGLEDPLERWLEQYPNINSDLTIRQLLNHSSGLYNYFGENFSPALEADLDRVWLPEELLKYVGPPQETLGNIPKYSNTNYLLLGMIIEAATGKTLEQELRDRITGPLHLESTYLAKNKFNPERWANNTALFNSLYSSAWAGGAIVSTPKDIAKWSHTLYSGNFLHPNSLESMFETEERRNIVGLGTTYMGFGVFKLIEEGQFAWGHTGSIGPFYSKTFYLPEFGLSVAYSSSGLPDSEIYVPGSRLVSAFIENRPDNISMCFDS
jgi:D-alanyl-D-alanine carboxypeptidase